MNEPLHVVKVGGSLYDLPDLGPRLRRWLGARRTIVVPGGGPCANAVRTLDRVHRLGDEAAHWLALHALSLNACFLARLLPEAVVTPRLPGDNDHARWFILDALPFFEDDERRPDPMPHTWDVTSDSLAVRVALRAGAEELVLLKSVPWCDDDWARASAAGIVDGCFPSAVRQAPELCVRIVNLRDGSVHLAGG